MTNDRSQKASAKTERRPIVVLLIDAERSGGLTVGRLLEAENDIELHCCSSAAQALDYATRVAPTVILQDIVMPDVDGVTLVGLFRRNRATASTPIVVMSGNHENEAHARAIAAGADDVLVKLPDKDTLVACLRRHAGPSQSRRAAAVAHASTAGPANETLDRAVIAELREMGADFITGLLDQFVVEAASLIERLEQATQQLDTRAMTAAAHSLKGASMTMGARRLAALSAQLEDRLCKTGRSGDSSMTVAIAEEFARVRAACLQERNGERSPA